VIIGYPAIAKTKLEAKYFNVKGFNYYEATLDKYKKIDSDPYTEFGASYIDVYQCGYMGTETTCVDIAWYINLDKSYKNVTVSGLIIEVYNLVGSGVDYMIYVAGSLVKSGHYDSVERDVNRVDYVANYSNAYQIEVKIRYFVTKSGYAQLTRNSILIASLKIRIYYTDDDPIYDSASNYYIYTVDIPIPSTFDPEKIFDAETNIENEVILKAISDSYVSEISFETGYDPDSATDQSVVKYEVYDDSGRIIRSGNASYSKFASFYPVSIDDKSYATISDLGYSTRYTLKVYMKKKMALGLVKIEIGFQRGILLVYYNNKTVIPFVVHSDDVYYCDSPNMCEKNIWDWIYIGNGTKALPPLDGVNALAYGIIINRPNRKLIIVMI
jgi:hypothetical protein